MNATDFINTYIVGFILNVLAGIAGFLLIRRLFEWLPTSADLHEKFRSVKKTNDVKEKISALTPLIFISFFWLFLANMLLIVLYIFIEVLYWPELAMNVTAENFLNIPSVNQYLGKIWPGLVIGRSCLFVIGAIVIAICFNRGIRIARQCWEVYRATETK